MKRSVICISFVFASILFFTCKSREKPADQDANEITGESLQLVWNVDYEKKTMTRNPAFSEEDLTQDSLVTRLNRLYEQTQLSLLKQSGDTLYLEIKNAVYLTEKIGSYGAAAYLTDVILNLTSIPGVHFVSIYFEEGSHLSPGVWSREDLGEFKENPVDSVK